MDRYIDILDYVGVIPYVIVGFLFLEVFRLRFNILTPFDDNQEMLNGNSAAALVRGGGYLGYVIAMSGSLVMSNRTYLNDLKMFAVDALVALFVFIGASFVLDRVVMRRVNNNDAILGGNRAAALVEASSYVGLGIIMNAAFAGGGEESDLQGLLSALLFSALGLAMIMGLYTAYDFAFQRFGKRCIDDEIVAEKLPVAIEVSSFVLAMSITLWFSMVGDFVGWWRDIVAFLLAAIDSIAIVAISRGLVLKLLTRWLPNSKDGVHHGNMAKSVIVGFVSIGFALLAGLVTFG